MGWEENIRPVTPYVPGEQPKYDDMIKLNTNECPYPPAPGVRKAAGEFDAGLLRLYPDPEAGILVESLARYYGVEPGQVFVGVGSDEVLALAFLTFFQSGKPILFPDITYSFYEVWAGLYGIPYERKALDPGFRICVDDYLKPNGGIIFPNPNAPTGVLESVDTIEEIVKGNQDSVVIIDEAYIDFGGESCLGLIGKYDNLLVVQTFSKSRAMAGARIGFALGSENLIGYLKNVKFSFNSYTINIPSLVMGTEAVREDEYFKETVGKIIATRQKAKKELVRLGFTFPDSYGNFIFAKHPCMPAERIFRELREKKIFVRYFNRPLVNQYLRITVGTDEEMARLYQALEEILGLK